MKGMKRKMRHEIAEILLKQIQREDDACGGLESLIALGGLTDCDITIIQNMRQDKTDHMVALMAMVARYDGEITDSPEVAAALATVAGEEGG